MKIKGSSKILGLIGANIGHTYSPLIHNFLIDYYKLDAVYIVFDLKRGFEDFIKFFRNTNNIIGVNVTIPYKEVAFKLADTLSIDSENIGAVNTLKLEEEVILGYNTDINGFLFALSKVLNFNTKNKNIIILGSGGTCKTVAYACKDALNITIVSRKKDNIENLLCDKIKWKEFKNNKECLTFYNSDIIINTTPIGIYGETIELNWDVLKKDVAIFDLIYFDTPLIKKAKKRKINCCNGINMLIYQAVKSFEIWTNIKVDNFLIERIKEEVLNEE